MNKVIFFRGGYVEKGSSISNPLYLPNRRAERYKEIGLDDSYGLPFYMYRSDKEFDLNFAKKLAENRAWESAYPKELTDQIVVQFEMNELTFPPFSNKIRNPYKRHSVHDFISSFQELLDSPTTQVHIVTKDLTQDDLRLLSVKIGRRNFLGRFIYRDFFAPNREIEGNSRPLSEQG